MSYQSRIMLSLGAALLFSASGIQAQTADEIVKKHTEAVGGAAAWKKVNSLRMTGASSAMGMEMNVVVTKVRNVGARQDIEVQGTKNYAIMTPEKGWLYFPVQGMSSATELPAETVKSGQSQIYLNLVPDMSEAGYKFESAGMSGLDGKPVEDAKAKTDTGSYHRLKAIDPDGNATDLYFDKKFNLVKTSRMVSANGQEMESGSTYSNFQKQAGGIVVPMTIGSELGELKFTKIEVNPTIEPSYFKP